MNRTASKASAAALVLAAAGAGAQTGPTAPTGAVVYGLLDVSAGRFQDPGQDHVWAERGAGLSSSFIGFRGGDDLGGGLRARFGLEAYVGVNNGSVGRSATDAFFSRTSYVGLQGAFGTSLLGRLPTPLWTSTLLFNPFRDSTAFSPSVRQYYGSTILGGGVLGDSRWSNSVGFSSPEPEGGNGWRWGIQYNPNDHEPGSTGKNVGANLLYTSGPLSATAAWQRVRNGLAAAPAGFDHQTTYQIGASYEFPVVRLYGQAGSVKTSATVPVKTALYQLGAVVPLGLGFVMGSYGHARTELAGTSSIRRTISFGYDYFLSKNTDIYAVWMNEQVTALSSANTFAAGLRLRF
jgi:predicted porin